MVGKDDFLPASSCAFLLGRLLLCRRYGNDPSYLAAKMDEYIVCKRSLVQRATGLFPKARAIGRLAAARLLLSFGSCNRSRQHLLARAKRSRNGAFCADHQGSSDGRPDISKRRIRRRRRHHTRHVAGLQHGLGGSDDVALSVAAANRIVAKCDPLLWMSKSLWAVAAYRAPPRLPAKSTGSRMRRAIGTHSRGSWRGWRSRRRSRSSRGAGSSRRRRPAVKVVKSLKV